MELGKQQLCQCLQVGLNKNISLVYMSSVNIVNYNLSFHNVYISIASVGLPVSGFEWPPKQGESSQSVN